MSYVEKFEDEIFTILFDVINRIQVGEILIYLDESLRSNKIETKNLCRKFHNKLESLQTQNMISNDVSCFINFLWLNY